MEWLKLKDKITEIKKIPCIATACCQFTLMRQFFSFFRQFLKPLAISNTCIFVNIAWKINCDIYWNSFYRFYVTWNQTVYSFFFGTSGIIIAIHSWTCAPSRTYRKYLMTSPCCLFSWNTNILTAPDGRGYLLLKILFCYLWNKNRILPTVKKTFV